MPNPPAWIRNPARGPLRPTPPPEAMFMVGAASQYLGAAVAVSLFDDLAPTLVALCRLVAAGVVLGAVGRVWRRRWTRVEVATIAAFGLALAGMNTSIYLAFDRLPLGNAVAIEFLGPVLVAAAGVRTRRALVALVTAVAGVALLSEVSPEGSLPGVALALLAGLFWAGYIIMGHRAARTGLGVPGLGAAMGIGALAVAPLGVPHAGALADQPWLLVPALATGVLSSVIPYTIDQTILRRVRRDRFALLQALLPVTATIIGFLALGQRPRPLEAVGVLAVAAAVSLTARSAARA